MFHNNEATVAALDSKGLKYVAIFASLLFKSVPIQGREVKSFTTTEQR